MRREADPRLWLSVALVIVVTAACTVTGFRSVEYLFHATGDAAHSRATLGALDLVLSDARDAETGQRGFIITGDSTYLEPYDVATASVSTRLRAIDTLTRDEPTQQQAMQRLRGLLNEKMSELAETIELRATSGFAAAEAVVRTGRGKASMDSLRAQVGAMTAEEGRLLGERVTQVERMRSRTRTILLLEGLLELATLAVLVRSILRYIAARNRNRAELIAQRETFRTTVASIGDAVITTDLQGRISYMNAIAEQLTASRLSEANGQPLDQVFAIVNEATRAPVANPAERALKEGIIVGLANHTVLIARDGTEIPIDDSAAPIRDVDGRVTGAVLVFRDISEKKAAERALNDAYRRKDEFLAVLAHELRNPLAPLRNALEILRLSPHDRSAVEQAGSVMERQLEQMVRLIDDLLDVSRITQNRLELRRATFDISQAVHAAIETSAPLLRASGHTLQVTLPPDPIHVNADRARLTQAFSNLLSNAIKYTDVGGRIALTVFPDAGHVTFSVRDSGRGIPAAMLDEIFEMFVQVDRSLERTQPGLGIGLPLVKRIIELHDGSVTARSDGDGRGSEFIVRLPTVTAPLTRPRMPMPEAPSPSRRVLIADDNQDAAQSLAAMLRILGHVVCSTSDGVEAVRAGADFRPEVALLDIGMPRLNGYDAAREIRETSWGRDIVLVALTGWGQDSDRAQSAAAGFDHHLVKPVDAAELNALLANLRRRR